MVSRRTFFKGNRCAHCDGIRSDQSALWCRDCVAKYSNSDHTHVNQFFNKTSEWQIDKDGCSVRWHGDINITELEVCIS